MSILAPSSPDLTVCITGPSASGKTTVANLLCSELDFEKIPGDTTRPIRQGEIDAWDFRYIGQEQFDRQWAEQYYIDPLYAYTQFNGFSYGSPETWLHPGSKLIAPTSTETTKQIQERLLNMGRLILWVHLFANEMERTARLVCRGVSQEEQQYRLIAGDSIGVKPEASLNINSSFYTPGEIIDIILEKTEESIQLTDDRSESNG